MHVKLLELVKKAGLKTEIMIDDSNRDVECIVTAHGAIPTVENWEKFAKLIVQECTLAILVEGAHISDELPQVTTANFTKIAHSTGIIDAAMKYTILINQHFGLK